MYRAEKQVEASTDEDGHLTSTPVIYSEILYPAILAYFN